MQEISPAIDMDVPSEPNTPSGVRKISKAVIEATAVGKPTRGAPCGVSIRYHLAIRNRTTLAVRTLIDEKVGRSRFEGCRKVEEACKKSANRARLPPIVSVAGEQASAVAIAADN
jgi:hypothetical protein